MNACSKLVRVSAKFCLVQALIFHGLEQHDSAEPEGGTFGKFHVMVEICRNESFYARLFFHLMVEPCL